MPKFCIALLFFSIYCGTTVFSVCPDETWTPYEGKKCLKLLETTYENYENAKNTCAALNTEATLVMVKDLALQTVLSQISENLYDNIWLGAKFDDTVSEYKWVDGTSLTYHNFQTGFPRNQSGLCVVMHPPNAKKFREVDVKWQDVPCTRPNLKICEIDLEFTLQKAEKEIRSLKTDLNSMDITLKKVVSDLTSVSQDLSQITNKLVTFDKQLEEVNKRVVPVGSIYIGYPNQPDPTSLWPDLSWEDVTTDYANMFFRAMGDKSASWGAPQEACAPRISKVEYKGNENPTDSVEIPEDGWSTYVLSGYYDNNLPPNPGGLRYKTEGCEVHPKNLAIKFWRRKA